MPTKVPRLEDVGADARASQRELDRAGNPVVAQVADSKAVKERDMEQFFPSIMIAGYSVPDYAVPQPPMALRQKPLINRILLDAANQALAGTS